MKNYKQNNNNYQAAEKAAAFLLKYRMRSEKELYDRLINKGFEKKIINELIDNMKKMKLINDDLFTYSYLYDKINLNLKGPLLIKEELKLFGIDHDTFYNQLKIIEDEIDFHEIIKKIITKKMKTDTDLNKIKNYLYKKGFEKKYIEKAIEELGGDF